MLDRRNDSATALGLLVGAWVLGMWAPMLHASPGDAREFDAGLVRVRSLMDDRRWDVAQDALLDLLDEHANADYVLARRSELVIDLERCAFHSEYDEPRYEDLIQGDLLSYNRTNSKVKVGYEPSELDDFLGRQSVEILGMKGQELQHPLDFSGPYSIRISSSRGTLPPFVSVCNEFGQGYLLALFMRLEPKKSKAGRTRGRMKQEDLKEVLVAVMFRVEGDEVEVVDEKSGGQLSTSGKYDCQISVSSTRVTVKYNGSTILSASKPRDLFGSFGLVASSARPFDELVVEGEGGSGWLQGLADRASTAERERFEQEFDRDSLLPEWLRGDVADDTPALEPVPAVVAKLSREVSKLLAEDRIFDTVWLIAGALESAESHESGILPDLQLMAGQIYLDKLGDLDLALEFAELASEHGRVGARVLLARIRALQGEGDESVRDLEAYLLDAPGRSDGYHALAWIHLRAGDVDAASDVVLRARRAGVRSADLEGLDAMLAKARRGPSWGRHYEWTSDHYEVHTDIDAHTARQASAILEEAYDRFVADFGKPPADGGRKFQVFLFAGAGGYHAYARDAFGTHGLNTLGMYSPALQQLLIWNAPDRAQMMRTVRHEGFHQFLDRWMDAPPKWFNEGLAEYYENLKNERNRWEPGRVELEHRLVLNADPGALCAIPEFLSRSDPAFMQDPISYPQAWAFIHFLNHTTEANETRFLGLVEAFKSSSDRKAVVAKVFADVDLMKLDRQFKEYVQGMK